MHFVIVAFRVCVQAVRETGRKPSKPGAKMMYSEIRILARKAREEAREISVVDHFATGSEDVPSSLPEGSHKGQSPAASTQGSSPGGTRASSPFALAATHMKKGEVAHDSSDADHFERT